MREGAFLWQVLLQQRTKPTKTKTIKNYNKPSQYIKKGTGQLTTLRTCFAGYIHLISAFGEGACLFTYLLHIHIFWDINISSSNALFFCCVSGRNPFDFFSPFWVVRPFVCELWNDDDVLGFGMIWMIRGLKRLKLY